MNDSTKWSALCHDYDGIRQDAFAYGFGARWRKLVETTRSGTATLTDWTRFLQDVEQAAEEERDIITKGDPLGRRLAALRAESGDYTCATSRCDRSAQAERVGVPATCALFDRPMAPR